MNRQRGMIATLASILLVATAWYAIQQLPPDVVEPDDTAEATIPLSPGLYGSPGVILTVPGAGNGYLVETQGLPAPLVVVLRAPLDDPDGLAGIQAMFERGGIASITLPMPTDSAALGALLTWVEQQRIARSQPVAVAVPGTELPDFLAAGGDRGGRDIMVLGAPPVPRSLVGSALARLPGPIRPEPDTVDVRLAEWADATIVIADPADSAVARRLAGAADQGRVVLIEGEPLMPPSIQPDIARWRDVMGALAGVRREPVTVIVGGDSFVAIDSALVPTLPPVSAPTNASSPPQPRTPPPPPR